MKKLFVVYETKNEKGGLSAYAAKISQNESIYWWLKDRQAVNCFWFSTWKEAMETAERWNETYRMSKSNKED